MYRKSIRTPNFYSYKYYLSSITICLIVGIFSSFVTKPEILTWYPTLIKPSFTPPNWVFGPVWFMLYVMMGTAWGHIRSIQANLKYMSWENMLFCLQLFLNFAWPFIYFGSHEIGVAWAEICLLSIVLIKTTKNFYQLSKFAGYLMIPYVMWTLFANVLNGSIWYLNR